MHRTIAATVLAVLAAVATADAAARTRFWNLTDNTVNGLWLAPAGTTEWGANQALNDNDKTVDHDERLKITGTKSGTYDVKLTDVKGRSCIVKGVKVTEGDVFSIEEKELEGCHK
jgi:hypothetical protein